MPLIREIRRKYRGKAMADGLDPRDVDLLLQDAFGRPMSWLLAHDDEPVPDDALGRFEASWARRRDGEPVQYIRGFCEFYGRDFVVDRRVLIPRPETEILVETAIAAIPREASVVDIGTGSGCIAISLQLERPDLRIVATDVSLDALRVARLNQRRLGSEVRFLAGAALSPFRSVPEVVVSNPPYIGAAELDGLQREVRDFEPLGALSPGDDPLSMIRELLLSRGNPRLMILEIGYDQRDEVRRIAEVAGWTRVTFVDDLAAIQRVAVLAR